MFRPLVHIKSEIIGHQTFTSLLQKLPCLPPKKDQMCPKMQVNEMHALYGKHRKVQQRFLLSYEVTKTHNSVKYEVI